MPAVRLWVRSQVSWSTSSAACSSASRARATRRRAATSRVQSGGSCAASTAAPDTPPRAGRVQGSTKIVRSAACQAADPGLSCRPMDAEPLLFDAVIFDLDGTLVSTELFWVEAARAGARRAFAELGLARELPAAEDWLSMVGMPLARGFELVFPDLPAEARDLVRARCVEEEERALRAGSATLMPGAREVL